MGGHSSLAGLMPYKDANAIMLQMGDEILPVLQSGTPLLAGVCGTDPFRRMYCLLRQIIRILVIRVLQVRVTAFFTSKIHGIKKIKKNAPLCFARSSLITARINT
jgi:predicted TIM-barrel enzyme